MGAKISKRYCSYKLQSKVFKLYLNFLLNGLHKTTLEIFETLSFRYLICFFFLISNLPLYHMGKAKPQVSGKRVILKRNGVKFRTRG